MQAGAARECLGTGLLRWVWHVPLPPPPPCGVRAILVHLKLQEIGSDVERQRYKRGGRGRAPPALLDRLLSSRGAASKAVPRVASAEQQRRGRWTPNSKAKRQQMAPPVQTRSEARRTAGAGAGSGAPHQFSYPDKDAPNVAVLQYANAEAGAEGVAQLVTEAAAAAIKARTGAHGVAALSGAGRGWCRGPALRVCVCL